MSTTKQKIDQLFNAYKADEEKFLNGNDRAGKRARAQLLDISKLIKERRQEIQEERNKRAAEKKK
ncbi:hypothetical protein [uncultured Chryseobacterium sp.]|uniref:hypothetical protein n=1 Tax=uncultured Chryseobacterium sp. TaxID=259322 RepID=UPI0025DDA219|nr:hypothetical protein [uncultured Chryseobacterium sp.]